MIMTYSQNYLSSRSNWLEQFFIFKKYLLERRSCFRQLGILKKSIWKSSCFKWLFSFQFNRCCSDNIAALITSFLTVAGILKSTERRDMSQIGSLQIWTSEKCIEPLEESMTAGILRNNYSNYCWKTYSNNRWLQVLLSK